MLSFSPSSLHSVVITIFALRPPMQKYASLGHLGLTPIRLSSLAKPRWALGGHEHGTLPYVAEHNKRLG